MSEKKKDTNPKKKPIEQAEDWANRDIPDDAQQVTQAGPTYENPNSKETA